MNLSVCCLSSCLAGKWSSSAASPASPPIPQAGAEVEISVEGVFDLAKVPADALAAGAVKVTPSVADADGPRKHRSIMSKLTGNSGWILIAAAGPLSCA
jgi:hypothetical protein